MEPSGSQGCAGGCAAFLRSRKGLVLLGEISRFGRWQSPKRPGVALCVLALVCYGASYTPGYSGLAVCELAFAVVATVFCITGLHRRLPLVHWGWTDFIRCVIGALLFLITSLIVIIGHRDGAGTAAGVFGLLAGLLLGYDAYISLPTRQSHVAAPTESPEGP